MREKLRKPYQQAYEEAYPWLSSVEPPIRAYIGDGIANQFFTPDRNLKPELMRAIAGLRKDLQSQFGIPFPGVKFRDLAADPQDRAGGHAFRIEMVNQSAGDADAQPIQATGDGALAKFMDELRWRCFALRTRWITAEEASDLRKDLPGRLREWLEERYTLTDLKLILRAVILPDEKEQDLYEDGL